MRFVKLNSICTFKQWKTLPIKELLPIGYPVYGANGIIGYSSSYNHTTPTLMICCRGATCGAINSSFGKCYINGNAMALDNLSSEFDFDYVRMFLKHFDFSKIVTGAAQPQITQIGLSTIQIPKLSLEQQRHISKQLLHFETLINVKYTELSDLDSLVKSRFMEMFGDPMDEKKWNSKFTEVVIFNPKKSEVKKDMEIEASFVPMEAIGTDGSFSIKKSGKIKDFYKGYTYFKDGDVIFAKITPCFENGKIAIASHCTNKIGFGTTEFHVARPISGKTNAEWVMNLLKNDSLHTYASSKMTGSAGQKRIQTPFFEKLGVYLPPLELQKRFADFVHLVDKSRFVVHSRYFLWLNFTFVSSTIAYSRVVSILECPKRC